VFLGVQPHNEAGDIHHLLANSEDKSLNFPSDKQKMGKKVTLSRS
jgi:hypothetical protein